MTSPLTRCEQQQHTLIGLLQAELQLQSQLMAQRTALQSLNEGMTQLLSCCTAPHATPMQSFHTLHELLMEDEEDSNIREDESNATSLLLQWHSITYTTVCRQVLQRRLLDIHGLPASHKLLCGSLQGNSLYRLLPHIAHWTSRLSAILPGYTLSHNEGTTVSKETDVQPEKVQSKPDTHGDDTTTQVDNATRMEGEAQSVTIQRFYLVTTALWRLLDFLAYITGISQRAEETYHYSNNEEEAERAECFYSVLVAQRPMLRFVVAELSSVRDVLSEEVAYRRAHQLLWPTQTMNGNDDSNNNQPTIDLSFASPLTLLLQQCCVSHAEEQSPVNKEECGRREDYDPASPCELPPLLARCDAMAPAMRLLRSTTSSCTCSAMWMSVAETMQLAEYADEVCRRLSCCIAAQE